MCPSVAVLAGGGDAGGGGGNGAGDGSGDNNAGAGSGGENAEGDGRGAPDYQKHPECGYASHPVDVVTGRAFTHPIVDLELPGPLPLTFSRMYSSKAAHLDMGIGFGWAHTFGWKVEVRRRSIVVWNEQGIAVDFPLVRQGEEAIGPWGWVLRREAWGFAVDADDGLWHLFSEVDPRDASIHLLTAVEDRNRNRISLTYDDGRLVEVKDSAGRVIKVIQTREGRIGSIQVQNAISQGQWIAFATYTYDDHGNLATATDADGHSAHYEYDEDHRLTLDQDRVGLTFHFVYDHEGRCIESWGDYPGKRDPSLAHGLPKYLHDGKTRAKGIHHCKFEYGDNGYTEVVDSTQVRRFFGNKHGTLDKAVEGGGVMTAVYRDDGHIIARTDPMGGRTQWERDERGRVLKVTDALGRVTTIARDAAGLPVEVIDPAGGVSQIERDQRGNILLTTDPAGASIAYRYDDRGLLVEVVSPVGGRRTISYDDAGNLVAIADARGGQWRFAYDALGRATAQTDPLGAETRFNYSPRGDLLSVRDAQGGVARYAYDGERHLIQTVRPSGGRMEITWGGYNRISARKDANGGELRFVHDLEGHLVEVRNERGEAHRFGHDPSGRVTAETTFDGRELRYRYDLAGRLLRVTNGARESIDLTWDLAGQLVARELSDGCVEEFEYDARGNLVRAMGPGGELALERDPVGRIVREAHSVGDEEHWVDVAYDASGQRVGRRTSLGHVESITRGPHGARTRTVLGGESVVEHQTDLLGREIARLLPSGGFIESAYDALGHTARRRAGGRSVKGPSIQRGEPEWLGPRVDGAAIETAYRRDGDGRLTDAWDRERGSVRYEYDPKGQLLARLPEHARAELFRYDATGNVHEAGASPVGREYGHGDKLYRREDTEYVWDAAARLSERRTRRPGEADAQVWSHRWDAAGRLQEVRAPDGTVVELRYDALARRVQKRVSRPRGAQGTLTPVSLTRFVWDGDVLVHEITTRAAEAGDPVVEERTYWFEDDGFEPVAHHTKGRGEDAGKWLYYVNDAVGTPDRLLSDDGRVVAELDRLAWGAVEGEAPTPIRSQGQYADEETGLVYNRYRYYDPTAGRFTSPDPIGLYGGTNAFAFAPDPISSVDPLGLAYTVSPSRRDHILEGDPPGTGHGPARAGDPNRAPGRRGAFPGTWSDDQAIAAVERVANSPNSTWRQSTGPGCQSAPITTGGPHPSAPATTNNGTPTRFEVRGRDHGQDVTVIVEPGPGGAGIITGYVR